MTTNTDMTAEQQAAADKISTARTQLLLSQPFWSSLLLRLRMEPFPENFFEGQYKIYPKTMATDGATVMFHPEFVMGLDPQHLQTILAHETAHCFLMHITRRGSRHPIGWNIACDYAINLLLSECGFNMPPGSVPDAKFKDLSAEKIYTLLAQESKKKGKGKKGDGDGDGSGMPEWAFGDGSVGQMLDSALSEADKSRLEQEWQGATEQAIKTARLAGNLPGSLERLAGEVRAPKVDWITQLRRFMENTIPKDYQWSPPSRRFISQGLYLPSILKRNLGVICVAVDTSGSVSEQQLQAFCSELNSIANDTSPEQIHVIYCDTQVQRMDSFQMGEEVEIKAKGGGGTMFSPVFKHVEKEGITPRCLIYCTDLESADYGPEPEYPVLWLTDSTHIAPWGETLQIEIQQN